MTAPLLKEASSPRVPAGIALRNPATLATFSKISRYALGIALLLAAAVVSHYFFRTADRAPFLAVDDALANIYAHLASEGSFGFPASPVQGLTGAARLDGFFNYGPIPFLLGAGLDWLFGTSYAIARSLHPIVTFALCLMAIATFRRSVAAAAIFCLSALALFASSSWPMVRPDIVVAGLGLGAVAAQSAAARTGRTRYWAIAGFCVAGAVTSHQIAWALAPALLLFWVVASSLSQTPSIGRSLRSLVSMSAGVAIALLLYAVAIEWRFAEVIELLRAYGSFASKEGAFVENLGRHLQLAFGPAPEPVTWLLAIAVVSSSVLSVLWVVMLGKSALPLLTWTLPALLTLGAYAASLGAYGNFHSGYVLLLQLGACWATAGFVAALRDWAPNGRGRLAGAADAGLALILSAALAISTAAALRSPPYWVQVAERMVSADDYLDEVIRPIPVGASVWGGIIFGLESGIRLDLVQFSDAQGLISDFAPAARPSLTPEYLIVNDLLKDIVRIQVANSDGAVRSAVPLSSLYELFPGQRYYLAGLVDAPPYGTTLVFERTDQDGLGGLPLVAAAKGAGPQWGRRLGPAIPIEFRDEAPSRFEVAFGTRAEGRARRSQSAELPPGTYLVTVQLENVAEEDVGLIVGTDTPEFNGTAGDTAFEMAQAIYFDYSEQAHLLVRHSGGRLYVSQFDASADADFQIASLRRLEISEQLGRSVPLPFPSGWTVAATGGELSRQQQGILVEGDNTQYGYQLVSQPVAVQPESRYVLLTDLTVISGRVAVGVLDETGQWLVPPNNARGSIDFSSNGNRSVTIVIANNQTEPMAKSRFHLQGVSLEQRSAAGDYIRTLVRCRSSRGAEARPAECL